MTDIFPYCCYMALPAEIMALRHNCYELYWESRFVAEFSNQLSAEAYVLAEF